MRDPTRRARFRQGARLALPFLVPTVVLGATFGVLAEPVMGPVAPVVMSIFVFAGSAQFAALSVLGAGGGAGPAIGAGLLMNARFLPMGFAIGPWLRGRPLVRAAKGQAVVDTSWALANQGGGRFDGDLMLGATAPQAVTWIGGTLLGVLGGGIVEDPSTLGLDAVFPAFYLALLAPEIRARRPLAVAVAGALIALVLLPVAPAGVPVIAASLAALVGLRR